MCGLSFEPLSIEPLSMVVLIFCDFWIYGSVDYRIPWKWASL